MADLGLVSQMTTRSRLHYHRSRRSKSSERVRVTVYVEGDTFGGVERHVLHLLDELDQARFDPTVLGVMATEMLEELEKRSIRTVVLKRVSSKVDIPGSIRVARAVFGARPDVFHAMLSQSYAAQYAILAAILWRTPAVVITAHLPTPSESRVQEALRRLLLRGVDVQILPSEWTRSELSRMGQLHRNAVVIANGIVLPALLSRQEAREVLGISPTATVIGGSMRLVEEKRADLVLEAARSLAGVVVVLLGSGPEENRLRSLAQGVDLRLPGFRADAVSLLRAFDVFVHPTPNDNQPLAILEAMGAGLPVVVADTGGAALMVDNERTGLQAKATVEGFAEAIARLLADPGLRESLGADGQLEAAERFTAVAMTRRVEKLYESLLGEEGSAPGASSDEGGFRAGE